MADRYFYEDYMAEIRRVLLERHPIRYLSDELSDIVVSHMDDIEKMAEYRFRSPLSEAAYLSRALISFRRYIMKLDLSNIRINTESVEANAGRLFNIPMSMYNYFPWSFNETFFRVHENTLPRDNRRIVADILATGIYSYGPHRASGVKSLVGLFEALEVRNHLGYVKRVYDADGPERASRVIRSAFADCPVSIRDIKGRVAEYFSVNPDFTFILRYYAGSKDELLRLLDSVLENMTMRQMLTIVDIIERYKTVHPDARFINQMNAIRV